MEAEAMVVERVGGGAGYEQSWRRIVRIEERLR